MFVERDRPDAPMHPAPAYDDHVPHILRFVAGARGLGSLAEQLAGPVQPVAERLGLREPDVLTFSAHAWWPAGFRRPSAKRAGGAVMAPRGNAGAGHRRLGRARRLDAPMLGAMRRIEVARLPS